MKKVVWIAALLAAAATAPYAHAVPKLQIYVEGATYDATGETWEFSEESPTRLWVIGDSDVGTGIFDVHLSVAYSANPAVTITLNPSTTNGYGGFVDTTIPAAAGLIQINTAGEAPKLGDGSSLPSHGEYGPGVWWQEFDLGHFTGIESPVADFIDSFPAPTNKSGQINVYEVIIEGASPGDTFHFDAYDHIVSQTNAKVKYKFAPFSHDGSASGFDFNGHLEELPEPGAVALLGLGLGLLALSARLRRRRSPA